MLRFLCNLLFFFTAVFNAGFCHKEGDTVLVLTKSLSPLNQPFVNYPEESVFPFCQTNMNKIPKLSFTQIFNTHRIRKSFYEIQFLKPVEHKTICSFSLNLSQKLKLQALVAQSFVHELFVDNLPVLLPIGFRVASSPRPIYALLTHTNFLLGYNKGQVTSVRVFGYEQFEILDTQYPGDMNVSLKYSVYWIPENDISFLKLFRYFKRELSWNSRGFQMSIATMIESFFIFVMSVGWILFCYIKFNVRYRFTVEKAQLEKRTSFSSNQYILLSALMGAGYQNFMMILVLFYFWYNPSKTNRLTNLQCRAILSLLHCIVFILLIQSFLRQYEYDDLVNGGWFSTYYYSFYQKSHDIRPCLVSTLLFLGPGFTAYGILSKLAHYFQAPDTLLMCISLQQCFYHILFGCGVASFGAIFMNAWMFYNSKHKQDSTTSMTESYNVFKVSSPFSSHERTYVCYIPFITGYSSAYIFFICIYKLVWGPYSYILYTILVGIFLVCMIFLGCWAFNYRVLCMEPTDTPAQWLKLYTFGGLTTCSFFLLSLLYWFYDKIIDKPTIAENLFFFTYISTILVILFQVFGFSTVLVYNVLIQCASFRLAKHDKSI